MVVRQRQRVNYNFNHSLMPPVAPVAHHQTDTNSPAGFADDIAQ